METIVNEENNIQLGDIIEIIAPENININLKQFYIKYIDQDKIVLVNIETNEILQLTIIENQLSDTSIQSINLLSSATTLGYASQNSLVPGTWIAIFFKGGEFRQGEIVDLEEDMIHVKLYPSNTIIYIDFEYKGINEELIESINIIKNPDTDIDIDIEREQTGEQTGDQIIKTEYEPEVDDSSQIVVDSLINNNLIEADAIDFGNSTYELTIDVEVSDDERRYTIEQQKEDLLDELISEYPTEEREKNKVIKNIHSTIERFIQLREEFSFFDVNDYPTLPKPISNNYKPLINVLTSLNNKIHWIVPVSKNKNILYDLNLSDILDAGDSQYEDNLSFKHIELNSYLNDENDIYKEYRNKNLSIEENYKSFIYNTYELNVPFNSNNIDSIYSAKVKSSILSIIDNDVDDDDNNIFVLDDETNTITTKKYFFEIYTNKLKTTDTNSDVINITSIITLPLLKDINFFNYFKIELPLSNILLKSVLALDSNYIYKNNQFNKDIDVIINNIEEDEEDEEDEEVPNDDNASMEYSYNSVFKYIQQYKPSKLYKLLENDTKYKKFLSKILLTNTQYFEMIKSISSNLVSKNSVIKELENFYIYKKDVNFNLDSKINEYVNNNIKNYKKIIAINKNNYSSIRSTSLGASNQTNWLAILENQESIKSIAVLAYDINIKNSNSELLNKIYAIDYGVLFINSLVRINLDLQTNKLLEEFVRKYEQTLSKVNSTQNSCKKLTKMYKSLLELEKDNGKEIYVDKEYDTTDYKFINKFINEKVKMEPEEFINFLIQKLIKKKHTAIESEKIAKALLSKKLLVSENDYAILSVDGTNKYFTRNGSNWVFDPMLLNNNVEVKDNKLFCNIQSDCIENNGCNSLSSSDTNTQEEVLKQIYSEFDETYDLQASKLRENIDGLLEKSINRITLIKKYNDTNYYKYDSMKRKLADLLDISKITISSPYEDLITSILTVENFVKKQNLIQKFVLLFTRQPFITEDQNWLYCNITSSKLLPLFLSTLANVFLSGKDYLTALDDVVNNQGTISDDGDTYVDKYSGYFIKNISFDTDDGYTEEGFKNKTRDVLEPTISTEKKTINYEETLTGVSKIILNIINAMTGNETMKIDLNAQKKFIIDSVSQQYKLLETTQEQYDRIKKNNKDIDPIEIVRGRMLIILTFAYILIAIQISIPNITSNKTFPNCIKGFDGYPFFGDDEIAITYISCIAKKIKNDAYPWNSIIKWNEINIKNEIMFMINKRKLLSLPAIRLKIDLKKKYLKQLNKNKTKEPEKETIINDDKLYGIYPFNITSITITPLIEGYTKKVITNIKSGNYKQHEQINTIKSKIIKYGLMIQKIIQSEINKVSPLIISKNGVNFIENACCDSSSTDVFKYFTDLNRELLQNNNIIVSLSSTIDKINLYSRAPLLYDIRDTKFNYPETQSVFSENTIYQTFIYFCKNKELNLSQELIGACGLTKIISNKLDLAEQIAELKSNNITYSNELFQKLLTIVYIKNKAITFTASNIPSNNEHFSNLLQSNPNILDTELTDLFLELLVNNSNDVSRTIKNVLDKKNNLLINNIKLFIATIVSKKQLLTYIKNLEEITQFLKGESTLFKTTNFMRNILKQIITVVPNIILSNINFSETKVPKHWDLSSIHSTDIANIISNHYKTIKQFYNNKELINVLKKRQDKMSNILKLCLCTPYFKTASQSSKETDKTDKTDKTDEKMEVLDERLNALLHKHYFLKILDIFIQLSTATISKKQIKTYKEEEDEDEDVEDEDVEDEDAGNDESEEDDYEEVKRVLAKYIIANIDISLSYKETINYNKETIMNKILKSKESEKLEITESLAILTEDEREIENILKNNKLEKWGIGLQKSLISYDKDAYDDDRMMTQQKILQKTSLDPDEFDFYNYLNMETDAEESRIDYLGENDDEIDND